MKTTFKLKDLKFRYDEEIDVSIGELETSFEGEVTDVIQQMKASMAMAKEMTMNMAGYDSDDEDYEDLEDSYCNDADEELELYRRELEM